jgi:hypothetical protein
MAAQDRVDFHILPVSPGWCGIICGAGDGDRCRASGEIGAGASRSIDTRTANQRGPATIRHPVEIGLKTKAR